MGHAVDRYAGSAHAQRWSLRYHAAVRRLSDAGFPVITDEQTGAEGYVALRAGWDPQVRLLADAMSYDLPAIDPASESALWTADRPHLGRA
jgi:hypothetical protein